MLAIHGEFETSSVEKMNEILKNELIRQADPFLALQRFIYLDLRMFENRKTLCQKAKGEFVPRIKEKLNKQSLITQDWQISFLNASLSKALVVPPACNKDRPTPSFFTVIKTNTASN